MQLLTTPSAPKWPGSNRLRTACEAKGVSVDALAHAVGAPVRTIRRYVSGQQGPSVPTLLAMAEFLGTTPDQIWPTATTLLAEMTAALDDPDTKGRWSVSKLSSYLSCPAKFYFQYVVGKSDENPSSPEAVLGTSVHAGIERLHQVALGVAGAEPVQALRSTLKANLPSLLPDPETGEIPDPLAMAGEAEKLLALYEKEIAPKFKPVLMEQRLEVGIAGVRFTVVLDAVDTAGWIRDTKTSKRRPSEADIRESMQATVYIKGYREFAGEQPQGVAFDYLIRNKTPVAETYTTTRSQRDEDRLARIVEGVTEAAGAGRFYPNPASKFGCGSCPFRTQCHETF